MNINAKGIIILILLLIASIGLNIYQWNRPEKEKTVEIIKTDTVLAIRKEFDTVFINNTKYKDVYKYDTIHHNQLVYIRDTVHNYEFRESDYTLGINAVRLDNYKLDIHTKDTVTVTNTVTTIVKEKRKPLGFGVFAGPSYDPVNKSFGLSVGCGLTFSLGK